ncbi:MAG: peptidyl-prolyl cis-trans isomerase [Phycisphaerales bacterium]|nr:MAG: peptidyl-prolyl cis-trans isomerase [Phycisphaerales bacterium]
MNRCVYLPVLVLLFAGGCGSDQKRLTDAELERVALTQKIELVEAAGGLVLMVGGETLSSDQIIESPLPLSDVSVPPIEHFRPVAQASDLEQFKERARGPLEDILIDRISNMLLYQYVKKQAGDNIDDVLQKAAESEYRKFVLGFGGDQARADEALKKRGLDRKSYMERRKRSILFDSYVRPKLPNNTQLTYRELMDCYDRMKDRSFAKVARITFRLIDIQPAGLDVTDPNVDRLRLATELADGLLARIQSGEDFGELAKQYSHGDLGAFGGLWRPVQPASLAAPYDVLAAEAAWMERGQVAGPIAAEGHVFIMKLQEKQSAGYEPFEQVQEQVREQLVFERQKEVFDRLNAKIVQQAELGRTDKFIDFCLEKIYQMSRSER